MSEVQAAKNLLRREVLAWRRGLPAEKIKMGSEAIAAHFYAWPVYRHAQVVMLYLAMPDEPQLAAVIEDAWSRGKTVCVPLMGEEYGHMQAGEITGWDDIITGRLGLKMPDPAKARVIEPCEIGLVVVPGVAFDQDGRRMGMGAGYYDRFLARAAAAGRVGLGWAGQVVERVPADDYDMTMDYLLTEGGFLPIRGGKA